MSKNSSNKLIRNLQKKFDAENRWTAYDNKSEKLGDCVCYSNIKYGDKYPNSYLDIYLTNKQDTESAPVLYYVHGGGYTWGDKKTGDPNGGSKSFLWYFERFLKEGYNIVSINYAFAPDYKYPIPILQMGQAAIFLQEHGHEYGIAMNKVVFAGSSAGGQLIGQFVNIQVNQAYADKIKIKATMRKESIYAVLFNSALLDVEKFGETGLFITDYLFTKCGKAYFGTGKLVGNKKVIEANVIENITKDYPPCFISDANTASFYKQAVVLEKKLKQLGVRHQLNMYPKKEKRLFHGFENSNMWYAQDNMEKMIEFLNCL